MFRVLIVALVVLAPVAAAVEPEAIQERAARLLENPAFQTEPPDGLPPRARPPDTRSRKPTPRAERSPSGEESAQRLAPTPARPSRIAVPAGGAAIAQAFLWVAVGTGLLLGVVALIGALSRRRRRAEPLLPAVPAGFEPLPSPAVAVADVDVLAAAGRFAEAVHLLLLQATARIAPRGVRWPESLTSREILAQARLGGERRDAFEELVVSVEHSLFGGRAVAPADWERCRAAFERLVAAGSAK